MAEFRFLGVEDTNVGLPDGSVVFAAVGTTHDLPFEEPGLLWELVGHQPPALLGKFVGLQNSVLEDVEQPSAAAELTDVQKD